MAFGLNTVLPNRLKAGQGALYLVKMCIRSYMLHSTTHLNLQQKKKLNELGLEVSFLDKFGGEKINMEVRHYEVKNHQTEWNLMFKRE